MTLLTYAIGLAMSIGNTNESSGISFFWWKRKAGLVNPHILISDHGSLSPRRCEALS